ncbi:MAG: UDP-glucose dehydrogenase family protein [Promethearchaeota archaeon]
MTVTCILGAGYVGLTYAAGLALKGMNVHIVDVNQTVVDLINAGKCPIDEPGLPRAIENGVRNGFLKATSSLANVFDESRLFLVCVGTYCDNRGNIDLSQVKSVARDLRDCFARSDVGDYKVICVKSTVICGTTDGVVLPIIEESGKVAGTDFGLAMSPEFLKEGSALEDILHPDKLVIGGLDDASIATVHDVLGTFLDETTEPGKYVVKTDLRTAELIKYAQNSFLATKISFINEMANFSELFGVNVADVARAIGMDTRISPAFLQAGPGFGGSCFPKDVRALYSAGRTMGFSPLLLESVLDVNKAQKRHVVELLQWEKDVDSTTIAILGMAFKANTGDTREAVARAVIRRLRHLGAKDIRLHDPSPHAVHEFKNDFPEDDVISYHESVASALQGAEACIILTEWGDYKKLVPKDFSHMVNNPVIIDTRRILSTKEFEEEGMKLIVLGESRNRSFIPK